VAAMKGILAIMLALFFAVEAQAKLVTKTV
jgi:hypothetical protein